MHSNKINRILAVVVAACLAICLRALHLGVIQREARLIDAQKPQSRTLIERADRGTICDRFGIPMALNRICYNATIYYNQIAQFPQVRWKEENGKRIRTFPRKEYIHSLAEMLGEILGESPLRIEDLIHSKASLFPNAPYLIKSRLSEMEHYRLKALEKDWPGICAETGAERFYPLHKVGCHILGTMGAISQKQYSEIVAELSDLQEAVEAYEQGMATTLPKGYASFDAACERLRELREKAYTLSDFVGKSGVEAQYEEQLRGYFGKKIFEVDQKGRFVREMAGGKGAVPGRQVTLSISAELQEFAEELLAASEKEREGRILGIDPIDNKRKPIKQPWIKGGAIIAIEPNSGEILAMASFPRFDPNDFIAPSQAKMRICRWLENEKYIKAVWEGRALLAKEQFASRRFVDEETPLTWDLYLDIILPKEGPLRSLFQKYDDVKGAIQIQEDFETVRYFSKISNPSDLLDALFSTPSKIHLEGDGAKAARRLEGMLAPIVSNKDKLFAIDLFRLCIDSTRFSDSLIEKIGSMKLNTYRELMQSFFQIEGQVKEKEAIRFRNEEFRAWRESHQKPFLEGKRKEEKEKKTYARPYIDYLDEKEAELFAEYWTDGRFSILQKRLLQEPKLANYMQSLPPELGEEFARTFRSFDQLDRPLLGSYRNLTTEKELAASFYPRGGFGYLRSYAFQTSAPQGSLFKLVTAYEGLRQGHCPVIIDDAGRDKKAVAYTLNGAPYPRMYKGGRLPRTSKFDVGKIDVVGALEKSSNPYFSLIAGDYLADPDDLKYAAARLGYGERSGLDLPGEASGLLPDDLRTNRTSLYSFAFGQHTLLSTPLQTAMMLSAIANGGKLIKPKVVLKLSGLAPNRQLLSAFDSKNGFVQEELRSLGIPFSLFTGVQTKQAVEEVGVKPTEIRRTLSISPHVRSQLFEGMYRTMWSHSGSARPGIIRLLRLNPQLYAEHSSLQHQVIGKTSTAEILHRPNLNPSSPAQMVKYIWFGTIAFSPDFPIKARYDHPDLVVVAFLRFGDAGKEAAPLAVQMVKKWQEIKKKRHVE